MPDLHVNHHDVTLYLPPGVDSVNLSDAAQGYPDGIENLPEGDPENPVYYFNFFELVYLEDYIHPNNLEGSNNLERSNKIERSSFSFSEPIEDKEVVNSPNISLNNYNNEGFPFNSVEIESRISSSASQAREVNMSEGSNSGEAVDSSYSDKRGSFGPPGRADNFSSGESEVTLISADYISRNYIPRDGAPSPQFFIPEPPLPSIPIDSYSPRDSQEVGDTLEPNLLNREEEALPAAEIDANLAREVLMNADLGNQTVVETIDPSLLIPIQPINPKPVEAEDSPLSSIGDEELLKLEQEIYDQEELSPSMEEEASGEVVTPKTILSSEDSYSERVPSPDGMEIDGDNPSIPSPNIEPGQDKSMDIDDNSSLPENPEGNAQYDTRMEDIDEVNQEGLVDTYPSLDFDPCGVSTDFFGYSYDGDMIIRSTQEILNMQARYEDRVNNSQVSSPLGGDTEGRRLPIINASYQRGESVDDRSRTEVARTALSDIQANQEQTGQILESNLLNREEEALPALEIDANLAREVLMNADLGNQTVVETIDPSLLIPIQPINPKPVEAEDSPLSSIGDEELLKLEQEIYNREELSPSIEEESEDSLLSSIGDREMSELEREFNPNPSSEVEAAVETRDPSLLLPSQLIPIQAINPEPVGYLELLQSSIGEREFNPNPSSEVEAVPGGDVDASGDEIAPGEEYGSPQEGAPYGVVTIHRVEALSQDVDASGDEIASGEEYGSPEEGAPWGTVTIRASGDVDTSGVVDPSEEDAPECRRTRRGMRLRSGRLI